MIGSIRRLGNAEVSQWETDEPGCSVPGAREGAASRRPLVALARIPDEGGDHLTSSDRVLQRPPVGLGHQQYRMVIPGPSRRG
jgi:hypothetical protein